MAQGGPGETQPGGVGPGVSHRFALPTGDVIPALKRLLIIDPEPVWLLVTSVIRTIHGEAQGTLGFHEPGAVGNWEVLEPFPVYRLVPMIEVRIIPARRKTNGRVLLKGRLSPRRSAKSCFLSEEREAAGEWEKLFVRFQPTMGEVGSACRLFIFESWMYTSLYLGIYHREKLAAHV